MVGRTSLILLCFLANGIHEILGTNPVTCGNHNIACDLSDLIETVSGVDRLEQCGDICLDDQNCKYYTYYGAESFPLQNVCFTFKSCGTVHSCDNCISEGRGCRNCLFEKVGQIKEENMITLSMISIQNQNAKVCA